MSPSPPITIFWESPQGRVLVEITHFRKYRRGHDRLQIGARDPENARLPLGDAPLHQGVYRAADIRKAGGVARFVERLILDAARAAAAIAPSGEARRTDARRLPPPAPCQASASHPLENELLTRKTYTLAWSSPTGPVTLTVTHTRTFFGRAHIVDIAVPPETPFPLDTLSYIVTDPDIRRAGTAKAFVESLIAAAESAAGWRTYAARAPQTDLFGASRRNEPPVRSRPGRPRLKLPAPKR
jgi:hypothetical protein